MTTKTDLMEMISNGENSRVEFKRDDVRAEDFAKELVAFSNMEGGVVLLGVENDQTISGIIRDDIEQWVMNICRDKIRPSLIPSFEIFRNVDAHKDVAVVQIHGDSNAHSLWNRNTSRYYIRVGTQSREASEEELLRLFQRKNLIRAERRSIAGTGLKDLDRRRLKNYFLDVRKQDTPADDNDSAWQILLENTEIMTEDGVAVGGMLLFGRIPNRFLPFSGVDAIAYTGTEQSYDFRDQQKLRGPMTPLLDDTGNVVVENGLVEQVLEFVQRNARHTIVLAGGRRTSGLVYPLQVIRESIVNALVHRDYLLTSTDIQLSIFSDRLEIVSPGRLPNGVTPVRMRAGIRATRNELLKEVMRDYRYLEHSGMGIPRKVIPGMKKHNDTEPDLVEQDERFIVRLFA